MADIRISGADLARMEQLQRRMSGAVQQLDARAVEQVTRDVSAKINAGVQKILANFETLQTRLGITERETALSLRRGLEAVEGSSGVVKELAPFLPLLASSPQARLGILLFAGLGGALEGNNRENARRAVTQGRQIEADFTYERIREIDEARDAAERRRAAARNAARIR